MSDQSTSPYVRRNGSIRVHRPVRKVRHVVYNSLGILAVIIGVVGIVVPVLPTTVFFIAASAIFLSVNPRLYRWLHTNRVTGRYLRVYTCGEGMSRRSKAWSIGVLWATLLVSAWFVREVPWLLAVLGVVGIGVSWHVATIRPRTISDEKLARHREMMDGVTDETRRRA